MIKKICALFLVLFITASSFAQSSEVKDSIQSIQGQWATDENGFVTYQRVIDFDGMSKLILFSKIENYFARFYKDANSVIQVSNKETGTIIGKGIYENIHTGSSMIYILVSVYHTLQVDCKDNKIRVSLSLTEYKQERRGGGSRSYFNYPIYDRYPISTKDPEKTVMGKAFYKAHMKALSQIEDIAAFVKTETSQTNNNW